MTVLRLLPGAMLPILYLDTKLFELQGDGIKCVRVCVIKNVGCADWQKRGKNNGGERGEAFEVPCATLDPSKPNRKQPATKP